MTTEVEGRCGAVHPDNPEARCMVSGYHPEHFCGSTGLCWENDANPPPADRRTLTAEVRTTAQRVRRIVVQSQWPNASEELDDALDQVSSNTDPAWRDYVINLIESRLDETFTADDVWARIEVEGVPFQVHDGRALGPVLVMLQRKRVIEWTGEYVASQRRHLSPIKVWRLTGRQLSSWGLLSDPG